MLTELTPVSLTKGRRPQNRATKKGRRPKNRNLLKNVNGETCVRLPPCPSWPRLSGSPGSCRWCAFCVGPACASGFWSCRLVLLAGLALWLRRPGLSPSVLLSGLVVWPCLLVSSWPCSSSFSKEATTQGTDPKTGCFEGEATTQGPILKQVSPLTAVAVFYGGGIGGIGLCIRFSVFPHRLFSSRASMVFQSVLAFSEVLRNGISAVKECAVELRYSSDVGRALHKCWRSLISCGIGRKTRRCLPRECHHSFLLSFSDFDYLQAGVYLFPVCSLGFL